MSAEDSAFIGDRLNDLRHITGTAQLSYQGFCGTEEEAERLKDMLSAAENICQAVYSAVQLSKRRDELVTAKMGIEGIERRIAECESAIQNRLNVARDA